MSNTFVSIKNLLGKLVINHAIFVVLVSFYVLLLPQSVFAHVLMTDGSIGAVIHIDPEDDPVVGEQASFFFEFKDKDGKFNGTGCDCQATISKNGEELFKGSIYSNSDTPNLENSSIFFTFPERGIYNIEVTGKPQMAGAFQPFTLKDEIRVERMPGTQPKNDSVNFLTGHYIHFIVFGGGFIIFLIMLFFKRQKEG